MYYQEKFSNNYILICLSIIVRSVDKISSISNPFSSRTLNSDQKLSNFVYLNSYGLIS